MPKYFWPSPKPLKKPLILGIICVTVIVLTYMSSATLKDILELGIPQLQAWLWILVVYNGLKLLPEAVRLVKDTYREIKK